IFLRTDYLPNFASFSAFRCLRVSTDPASSLFSVTSDPSTPIVPTMLSRLVSTARLFWSGSGQPWSATKDWQRSLRPLFKLAGITNGHPHRFRDTFANDAVGIGAADVDPRGLARNKRLDAGHVLSCERHRVHPVFAARNRLHGASGGLDGIDSGSAQAW